MFCPNDCLPAFLQIILPKPNYDRNGDLLLLVPASLSDDLQEIIDYTEKTSEQERMLSNTIQVLAKDISKERNYLSRASKFLSLSSTLIIFALQAIYRIGAFDSNGKSFKNLLTF